MFEEKLKRRLIVALNILIRGEFFLHLLKSIDTLFRLYHGLIYLLMINGQ